MGSSELGEFWLGNVVLSKQDILVVMFVWLLISAFYLLCSGIQTARPYVVTP